MVSLKTPSLVHLIALGLTVCLVGTVPALAQDWRDSSADQRQQEIIERYLTILERRPRDGHVLDRLLSETGRGASLRVIVERYRERVNQSQGEGPELPTLLGHLEAALGNVEEALEAFDEALERESNYAFALRGKADLLRSEERWDEAEEVYESALEATTNRDDRQEILRRLADLSFSARRWEQASSYVEQMIAAQPDDPYLRMELAQLYLEYDRFDEALEQYRAIAGRAGTDMRQRAVAERDAASVLKQMGRFEEARNAYERARSRVSPDYWLSREIERALYQLYGDAARQQEFIDRYSERWRPLNGRQWSLIASAYREIGETEESIDALRRALRSDPGNNETRLTLIRALETYDRDEFADEIEELYREAITRARNDLTLRLQFIDFLEGEYGADRAVEELARAERVMRGSPDSLLTVADRYDRYGAMERSEELYQEIVRRYPRDPRFKVALGDYYFGQMQRSRAEEIWQQVVPLYRSREDGLAALGDIYADHGLLEEAIRTYEEARSISPSDQGLRQRLAELYERNQRNLDAADIWGNIYAETDDASVKRSAREALIRLYRVMGFLDRGIDQWSRRIGDSDDGRWRLLVGQAYLQFGSFQEAERELTAVLEQQGDSVPALELLEETYRASGKLEEAVHTLERIAELKPAAYRRVWDSLIDISLRQFRDQEALSYAEQAVAENPQDASAHARLGELYRTLGRMDDALRAYREAVDVNPRVTEYQFALAELLSMTNREAEALDVYLRIVEDAGDDSHVLRAGRRAIALALATGDPAVLSSILEDRMIRARDPAPILKLELELYRQWSQSTAESLSDSEQRRFEGVIRRALGSEDAGVYALAVNLAEDNLTAAFADTLMRAAVRKEAERERILGLLSRLSVERVSPAVFAEIPSMDPATRALLARIAAASDEIPQWNELSDRVRFILRSMAREDADAAVLLYRLKPELAVELAPRMNRSNSGSLRHVARWIEWKAGVERDDELVSQLRFIPPHVARWDVECIGSHADTVAIRESFVKLAMRAPTPIQTAVAELLTKKVVRAGALSEPDARAAGEEPEARLCRLMFGAVSYAELSEEEAAARFSRLRPVVDEAYRAAMQAGEADSVRALEFMRALGSRSFEWRDYLRDELLERAR
jgi:tetratricopeptide (TPR) repeat protein